jgi:hypothetical protein
MVAGRFEEDEPVDETIDDVFTLRMKPTRVRLRILKGSRSKFQFLAVQWA